VIEPTPLRLVPASALVVALSRHDALATAYRAGTTPELSVPSLYATAKLVVRDLGYFNLWRRRVP